MISNKCAHCGSRNHSTANCPQSGMFSSSSSSSSSSSDDSDPDNLKLIGGIIALGAIAVVLYVVYWLAVNLVLPVVLLNSALLLVIWAAISVRNRIVLAALAFVGAAYMLFDIAQGWFSASFINNVVGDPFWVDIIVWINAGALGFAVWFLTRKLWSDAQAEDAKQIGQGTKLRALVIIAVAIPVIVVPVIHGFYLRWQPPTTSMQSISPTTAAGSLGEATADQVQSRGKSEGMPSLSLNGDFNEASMRVLSREELERMDKPSLRIMRNEIFARHGYIFKSEDLRAHFGRTFWYKPRLENVDQLLTDVERANVKLIKQVEDGK